MSEVGEQDRSGGRGLAKLIEECGELMQVAGKRLAYYTIDKHPDGGPPLTTRLEDEIADVIAACQFVAEQHGLDMDRIHARADYWLACDDNNEHGIDAPAGKTNDQEEP